MRQAKWLFVVSTMAVVLSLAGAGESAIPAPDEFFGFTPGADRELADYEELTGYLQQLADASDRVSLREVGESPMGRPMYVLFLSTPDNLQRLEELREINQRLALETSLAEGELESLVERGRVFVMETLSMHSTEVAPSQALPLYAHEIATTTDPELLAQLQRVVLMMVPNHNPDGMDMVVENYRKYRGTRYEGSTLPGVYHRYVGHDNNRDFVSLTQDDTRVINRLYSTQWYPQVLVEKHQMGSTGPRYYVPENHDPIAENVDEALWSWSAVFGSRLQQDMGRDGLQGVVNHWMFDNYWPGSTETSLWKNVISFLTEAASCQVASPVYVEPTELKVNGKGLAEYAKSVNMPDPWPGGWWRLGDIVAYEMSSMRSILATAATHSSAILRSRHRLAVEETRRGQEKPPFYFVLPAEQHDRGALPELVKLLQEHGVRVFALDERVELAGRVFAAGSVVVPLAQPYRAFIKEVLEDQRYPVRHYEPGGDAIRPYDITSWSLPRHRGLSCQQVELRSSVLEAALAELPAGWSGPEPAFEPQGAFAALAWPAGDNASHSVAWRALAQKLEVARLVEAVHTEQVALAAGSFVIKGSKAALSELAAAAATPPVQLRDLAGLPLRAVTQPRIALVESYFHDMDAGWTRFVMDQAGIPFTVLRPGEVEETDLESRFDVLLFPDQSKEVLREGRRKWHGHYGPPSYPPQYSRPISKKGMQKIAAWIDQGGTVVSWGRSTALFTEPLEMPPATEGEAPESVYLPVEDVHEELANKGLLVPGSFLAVDFAENHPLTWGMPARGGVFSRAAAVFETSIPVFDTDRRVIATHPRQEILLSGYAEHQELLARKAIMVWLQKNRGQLVLMGFAPQFRASTPGTAKLLFNALLLPPPAAAQ